MMGHLLFWMIDVLKTPEVLMYLLSPATVGNIVKCAVTSTTEEVVKLVMEKWSAVNKNV